MNKKKDDRATVKAARINYWGAITVALITLIGVLAPLYMLQKTESPLTVKKENTSELTETTNNKDFQSKEKKLGTGTKEIEGSSADKVEPKTKNKESTPAPATTHIDKIENNGNLSIGQTGGTVNQTTIINPEPQPRHMTEEIMKVLKDTIPTGYVVDVIHPTTDEESTNFALEMLTVLNRLGYKTTRSIYGQIMPDLNQSHYIELMHQEQKVEIIVYKLK